MSKVLNIFIGYDSREQDAYEVCVGSLLRHSSIPLNIVKLDQQMLRYIGIYDRPFKMDGKQPIDERDGKPFSTEFSFSRFLVPALSLYDGIALFCDCDFLFTSDVAELLKLYDPKHAVCVVKHNHNPPEGIKMDGMAQTRYHRKNWSSFILWNNEHPANRALTTKAVNYEPGSWLHAFSWLKDAEIGELTLTWNYLSDVSAPWREFAPPRAIHYTLGTPNMAGHEACQFADLWNEELCRVRQSGNQSNLRVVA